MALFSFQKLGNRVVNLKKRVFFPKKPVAENLFVSKGLVYYRGNVKNKKQKQKHG